MLSGRFCDLLEAELAQFSASGLPRTQPNTMNRHGIILSELGLYPAMEQLVVGYVDVLASALLPNHTEGLDSFRAFTVLYDTTETGDRELALHYDNSEVTLNVNIGGEWDGGQVEFEGLVTEAESEKCSLVLARGHGVIHAGYDMHRAMPLTEGRRHNLILWCRSSAVRNERCPMCFEQPRKVRTNFFSNEGFSVVLGEHL